VATGAEGGADAGAEGSGAGAGAGAGGGGAEAEGAGAPQRSLDPDVAANVQLAWAKMLLSRLVQSHQQYIEGLTPPAVRPFDSPDSFPSYLRFASLAGSLPPPSELGAWGGDALADTFEQARVLFNSAMTRFKAALEFYELDGHVTEHVNILMEVSNCYRCLAGFEPDVTRRRLMHAQRVARLCPLHGLLNTEYFLGLVRSIALELGNSCREVMELEEEEGRPAAKARVARVDAVNFYTYFLDTFREPCGPGGTMPDRITDEANERYYLLSSFALGRLMSGGMAADRDLDGMALAVHHMRATADYVKRHSVTPFEREAALATEMAGLVAEKLDLANRLAARA
jgi:hypothetical protein